MSILGTTRRERAATTIQALARGVVGRELASDERNRYARINELLLKSLRRLGTPVLREWYKAARHVRRVREGDRRVNRNVLSRDAS